MRSFKVAALLSLLTFLFLSSALAQVQQSGTVTPNHLTSWTTSGVVKDAGSATAGTVTELGIVKNGGDAMCIRSASSPNPYERMCFGIDSAGSAAININSIGGAPSPTFSLNINGTALPALSTIPNNTILSNITGISALPAANSLTSVLDGMLGNTTGDVIYRSSGGWTTLGPGNNGNCLTYTSGGTPVSWGSCAGTGGTGTVTSITAGTGLTGGTITASGTIALSSPVAASLGGSGISSPTANTVLLGNGSSAFQTVAPSTSGNVLTSNGTTWVSSSPQIGALQLIQTLTANNSSQFINFTSGITAAYDEYVFVFSNCQPASNAVSLYFRISEDGGATYKAGSGNYRWATNTVTDNGVNAPIGSTSSTQIEMTPGASLSNSASSIFAGELRFFNPSNVGVLKPVSFHMTMLSTNPALFDVRGSGMYVNDGNAINAVQFLVSSGNINTCTISQYGMAK